MQLLVYLGPLKVIGEAIVEGGCAFLASFALECRNRFKDRHVIISSTTPQGMQEMKGVLTDAGSDFIEMDLDVLVNPENVWLIKLDRSA